MLWAHLGRGEAQLSWSKEEGEESEVSFDELVVHALETTLDGKSRVTRFWLLSQSLRYSWLVVEMDLWKVVSSRARCEGGGRARFVRVVAPIRPFDPDLHLPSLFFRHTRG